MSKKIVITFGTFDVFHIGHLNMLKRAKTYGDKLIVGVSTDALNRKKKGRNPVYSQEQRKKIVEAIQYVDEVFYEESLEQKPEYINKYKASIFVIGDDWKGKFDWVKNVSCCKEVIYLPRTPSISTTKLIEYIKDHL